ncbi:MAG: hypothetical protein A2X32_09340 [Elusimicrobia bacterium GWC2_64_44]|nr:MAG: hypothetical protein A2X32_09340 [Elusimicrobia bacterium GWC2_64_44]
MKTHIAEKAAALGFKSAESSDPSLTLAEVIESRELRYWEAFPVLLANAAQGGKLDPQAAAGALPEEDRKYLKLLILVSLALYDSLGARFGWRERLFGDMPARLIAGFRSKIETNSQLELGDFKLRPEILRENFRLAFGGGALLKGAARTREDEGLETALREIFTSRQRELLLKKLRRERFTKTEAEYYSRVVKKKARAVANDELHRLARRVLA